VISEPEVYKNSADNTYVIFGEAKIDEFGKKDWEGMTEEFGETEENLEEPPSLVEVKDVNETEKPETTTSEPEKKEKEEFGVPTKYIDLIMQELDDNQKQAISREMAATALKNNNNDIVQAIFELGGQK